MHYDDLRLTLESEQAMSALVQAGTGISIQTLAEVLSTELRAGRSVSVLGTFLLYDASQDVVWGTNAYGQDFIAAQAAPSARDLLPVLGDLLMGIQWGATPIGDSPSQPGWQGLMQ